MPRELRGQVPLAAAPVQPARPPPVAESTPVAAGLMVTAALFFVTLAALVKAASNEATPMQALLYRSVFSGLPLALAMRLRRIPLWSGRWPLLTLRGSLGFLALYCYLWAVTHIHLADVLSLQQMAPVFVALLSIRLLGERPRVSHFLLAGLCLLGTLLVIRPTRGIASFDSAVGLLSAVFSSGAYITVRALTSTEDTSRIVVWFSAVSSVLALPFLIPTWRWLSLRASLLLIGTGLSAAVAQVLMTAAFRRAPAHIASAFSYASVPLAYLTGLLVWSERPDALSNLGIALIAAGGVAMALTGPRPDPPGHPPAVIGRLRS